MIEKRVVLDQIECTASRVIQMRFKKQLVEDGTVLSSEYHRSLLEPGIDLDAQMGFVNEHLAAMGWPSVADADVERVRQIAAIEHTPEIIAQYQTARAAAANPS